MTHTPPPFTPHTESTVSARADDVRAHEQAQYATPPALPYHPYLPQEPSNSPSTPTSLNAGSEPPTVDGRQAGDNPEPESPARSVPDLMGALKASVIAAREARAAAVPIDQPEPRTPLAAGGIIDSTNLGIERDKPEALIVSGRVVGSTHQGLGQAPLVARRDFSSQLCPMPDCRGDLYVTYRRSVPVYVDFDARELKPAEAITQQWEVECSEGHVLLRPEGHDEWADFVDECESCEELEITHADGARLARVIALLTEAGS